MNLRNSGLFSVLLIFRLTANPRFPKDESKRRCTYGASRMLFTDCEDASGELERDPIALGIPSALMIVTEVPMPRTTMPVSPSMSKH